MIARLRLIYAVVVVGLFGTGLAVLAYLFGVQLPLTSLNGANLGIMPQIFQQEGIVTFDTQTIFYLPNSTTLQWVITVGSQYYVYQHSGSGWVLATPNGQDLTAAENGIFAQAGGPCVGKAVGACQFDSQTIFSNQYVNNKLQWVITAGSTYYVYFHEGSQGWKLAGSADLTTAENGLFSKAGGPCYGKGAGTCRFDSQTIFKHTNNDLQWVITLGDQYYIYVFSASNPGAGWQARPATSLTSAEGGIFAQAGGPCEGSSVGQCRWDSQTIFYLPNSTTLQWVIASQERYYVYHHTVSGWIRVSPLYERLATAEHGIFAQASGPLYGQTESCSDNNSCSGSQRCNSSKRCEEISCPTPTNLCKTSSAVNHSCSESTKADGTSCGSNKVCQSGQCNEIPSLPPQSASQLQSQTIFDQGNGILEWVITIGSKYYVYLYEHSAWSLNNPEGTDLTQAEGGAFMQAGGACVGKAAGACQFDSQAIFSNQYVGNKLQWVITVGSHYYAYFHEGTQGWKLAGSADLTAAENGMFSKAGGPCYGRGAGACRFDSQTIFKHTNNDLQWVITLGDQYYIYVLSASNPGAGWQARPVTSLTSAEGGIFSQAGGPCAGVAAGQCQLDTQDIFWQPGGKLQWTITKNDKIYSYVHDNGWKPLPKMGWDLTKNNKIAEEILVWANPEDTLNWLDSQLLEHEYVGSIYEYRTNENSPWQAGINYLAPYKTQVDPVNKVAFWRKDILDKDFKGEIFTYDQRYIYLNEETMETFPGFTGASAIKEDRFRSWINKMSTPYTWRRGQIYLPRYVTVPWNLTIQFDTTGCDSYTQLLNNQCLPWQQDFRQEVTAELVSNFNTAFDGAPTSFSHDQEFQNLDQVLILSQHHLGDIREGNTRPVARERYIFGKKNGVYYGFVRWDNARWSQNHWEITDRTIGLKRVVDRSFTFDGMYRRCKASGLCAPCTSNQACRLGSQCSNGVCVAIPDYCTNPIQCSATQRCNTATQRCQDLGCASTNPCKISVAQNQSCVESNKAEGASCGMGKQCTNGVCGDVVTPPPTAEATPEVTPAPIACPFDYDENGKRDISDLLFILTSWGQNGGVEGKYGVADLLGLLGGAVWGKGCGG